MGKKALSSAVALIALYLVVKNSKGFSTVTASGASGGTNLVKAFQGR